MCMYTVYTSPSTECVCLPMHVCASKFGLGQLQLCQSEPLQMPKPPEEEEKEEEGEE